MALRVSLSIKRTVRFVDVVLETHERYRRNVQREKEREIDALAFIAGASCMRIDRSRELKSGKAWIRDRCRNWRVPSVGAATFYHDNRFTCRCTILFLARLFAVDIYKDGAVSSTSASSFSVSPYLTCLIHATVVGGMLFRFL